MGNYLLNPGHLALNISFLGFADTGLGDGELVGDRYLAVHLGVRQIKLLSCGDVVVCSAVTRLLLLFLNGCSLIVFLLRLIGGLSGRENWVSGQLAGKNLSTRSLSGLKARESLLEVLGGC